MLWIHTCKIVIVHDQFHVIAAWDVSIYINNSIIMGHRLIVAWEVSGSLQSSIPTHSQLTCTRVQYMLNWVFLFDLYNQSISYVHVVPIQYMQHITQSAVQCYKTFYSWFYALEYFQSEPIQTSFLEGATCQILNTIPVHYMPQNSTC